jgi:Plasmid pRiA4b ORF-3-like protein
MPFDINCLNPLAKKNNIDGILDAMPGYIENLLMAFEPSSECQALLAQYPDIEAALGSWIEPLLSMGYNYEQVLLPQMTKRDVETIVTQLFPRKIMLMDPSDADWAIPELVAFWKFLHRAYKHPQAANIVKYLKLIASQFGRIMNDSSNFGLAKSFMTSGMAAGFDMTTEAGVQAFQQQYNANRNSANLNLPDRDKTKKASTSKGFGELLKPTTTTSSKSSKKPAKKGFGARQIDSSSHKAAAQPTADLSDRLNQMSDRAKSGDGAPVELLQGLIQAFAVASPEALETIDPEALLDDLERSMPTIAAEPLSEATIAQLAQQQISLTQPGSILQDFQTLLDWVGDQGIPVSSGNKLLPIKILPELNEKLGHPIAIDLKRPAQKSYPAINGLYLLLRTSGLGIVQQNGKNHILRLNPEILASWQSLNPTEQYFALLETWLIRASEKILGEAYSHLNEGNRVLQGWHHYVSEPMQFKDYGTQMTLNYLPGLANLALLEMFGFVTITSGKPDTGKGWRIKQVNPLAIGHAILEVVRNAYLENGMSWPSETDVSVNFGELQSYFQPYFPEWQANLATPHHEFGQAVYIFKVSLGKIWRRIAVSSDYYLDELAATIRESVDFDSDHLDEFIYADQIGRLVRAYHPYMEESPPTDEVRVGDLPLRVGDTIVYRFDFGDDWRFQLRLESIDREDMRTSYQAIIETHGKAPQQYRDWEDEDEE